MPQLISSISNPDFYQFQTGDEIEVAYEKKSDPMGFHHLICSTPTNFSFQAKIVHKFVNISKNPILIGWRKSTQLAHFIEAPTNSVLGIFGMRYASTLLATVPNITIPAYLDYFWMIHSNTAYFYKLSSTIQSIPTTTIKSRARDGETCQWCGTFFPMAEPNQKDGSLKCYNCRSGNRITKLPNYC